MASSYSTDLKLELMVTGENAGTWGDKTNSNLNLVQQAIAGFESIALNDGGNVALAMSDASLSNARNMVLKFTGTLTGASTVTIPDGIEKFYIIDMRSVVAPQNLTIKTVSGTGFTTTEAKIIAAYSDGTNMNEIALDTLGGTIGTGQIDDDSITSAKISANQITSAKIADNAVLSAAISANQIVTSKVADAAITSAKLSATTVTAGSYTVASITVNAQGQVTAASSGSAGEADELFFIEGDGQTGVIQNPESKMGAGTEVMVYAQGGAGGGGGNLGQNGGPFGGAQGSPGGMVFFVTTLSTALASSPYTLGAAGTGGPTGPNPGQAGGDTIVTNFITAPGGTGGDAGNRGPTSGGNPSNRGIALPPVNPLATVSYSPLAPSNAYGTTGGDGTLNNTFTNPKAVSGHIMRNVFSAPGTFATFGNNTGGAGAETNQNSPSPAIVPTQAGFAATGNAFIGIMVKN
jgi:hypothetical protein